MDDPIVTSFGTYDYEVTDYIIAWCDSRNVPPKAWLAIGLQECGTGGSSWNLYALGDSGKSGGIYQVYIIHPPHDPQYWMGFNGLKHSMDYLWRNRWQGKWKDAGGWEYYIKDQIGWLEEFADDIQGSEEWKEERDGLPWTRDLAGIRFGQADLIYDAYWKRKAARTTDVLSPLLRIVADGVDDVAIRAQLQSQKLRELAAGGAI